MTRAPRSASCRVANGAATACSSATTVIPSRGRIEMGTNPFTHFRIRQEITYDAAVTTASTMREIDVATIADAVERLLIESNYRIPPDILDALRSAAAREQSPLGRRTLEQLIDNYEVAAAEQLPVCQDS